MNTEEVDLPDVNSSLGTFVGSLGTRHASVSKTDDPVMYCV